MSSDIQPYILDELDAVIDQTVANIGLYTKNPNDFTRNRKLNATTTIKVTLNMQGNSLNAELLDAFPNLDERMTASAYEQAKVKLKPEIFEHILKEYNMTMRNPKLLDGEIQGIRYRWLGFYNSLQSQVRFCDERTQWKTTQRWRTYKSVLPSSRQSVV